MTGFTYGTWIVYETGAAPTAGYTLGAAEGVNYIKFQNSPKRGGNVSFQTGVMDFAGGISVAVCLGDMRPQYTIEDVATEAQEGLIEKFIAQCSQPAYAPYVYLVWCTADTPAVHTFYHNSATGTAYVPVRFAAFKADWDETNQTYKIKVVVEACWSS